MKKFAERAWQALMTKYQAPVIAGQYAALFDRFMTKTG
jgi:hypothetical protein